MSTESLSEQFEYSIYIYSEEEGDDGRSAYEHALNENLKGIARVSGGGSGQMGWNIDIEVSDPRRLDECIEQIKTSLRAEGVPRDTYMVVMKSNERTFKVYDDA